MSVVLCFAFFFFNKQNATQRLMHASVSLFIAQFSIKYFFSLQSDHFWYIEH